MLSRRKFIGTSSLAIAGTACGATPDARGASAQGTPPAKLPPSLMSLSSVRSQATPVTSEERRARLERSRVVMKDNGLDAIILAVAHREYVANPDGIFARVRDGGVVIDVKSALAAKTQAPRGIRLWSL